MLSSFKKTGGGSYFFTPVSKYLHFTQEACQVSWKYSPDGGSIPPTSIMTPMKQLVDMTEQELRELMIDIAKGVTEKLVPNSKFVILVFDDPGLAQYISNCQRSDIITAIQETANRLESKQNIPR